MGTPLLESLSAGVPVIANGDEPSFREWIINGENGFALPLSVSAWAKAICSADESTEDQRISMSNRITEQISTDTIDQQYWKLLQALSDTSQGETLDVAEVLAK